MALALTAVVLVALVAFTVVRGEESPVFHGVLVGLYVCGLRALLRSRRAERRGGEGGEA